MMGYGFYKLGEKNTRDNFWKIKQRQYREAFLPYIQAEADMNFLVTQNAQRKEEAEVMKNVPGWEVILTLDEALQTV